MPLAEKCATVFRANPRAQAAALAAAKLQPHVFLVIDVPDDELARRRKDSPVQQSEAEVQETLAEYREQLAAVRCRPTPQNYLGRSVQLRLGGCVVELRSG